MRKDRLQTLRDALIASGREKFNLSTYDTCIASYMATDIPAFIEEGFRPVIFTYGMRDVEIISVSYGEERGVIATAAFFEIPEYDAAMLTHHENYPEQCNGRVPTPVIVARIDAFLARV